MNRIAARAKSMLLLAALLLGGLAFFVGEFCANAHRWVVFPNSPHMYSAGNVGSGVVVDRDGYLILDLNDGRTYTEDTELRKSTLHWVGDRYGMISAPALPNYLDKSSGFDLLNGLYTYGGYGAVQTLTLSASVQKAALAALGDRKGTVAVYNYKTGQLLCSVTTPTYDPENVPEVQDGMYLNRFTQSSFTPGSIFKIVTTAALLEKAPHLLQETFRCSGTYQMGVDAVTCGRAHGVQTVKQAFMHSCNCAYAQIAEKLGAQTLQEYVDSCGVVDSVTFDGITTVKGNFQADASAVNLAWGAIGQYTDLINPCAFLTFVGAIANGGEGVTPYVVEKITTEDGTAYQAKPQTRERVMGEETAAILREYMRNNVANRYSDGHFPGLNVCAKTGTAEVMGSNHNATLAGFVMDEEYPLAFVVCVQDAGFGLTVAVPIASKVLAECKKVLDN